MPSDALSVVAVVLVPTIVLLHLWASPYTKVEESFNIQAIHDLLTFGYPHDAQYLSKHFDHVLFPIAHPVPRTFVGPLSLAAIAAPFDRYLSGEQRQNLVRALLGLYNAAGILIYRRTMKMAFGRTSATWFTLFSLTQFHVMYWATRTLPNFFVYGWSTIALALLLPFQSPNSSAAQRPRWQARTGLIILTILGIVFRSEVAALLGAHVAFLFLRKQLSVTDITVSAVVGLASGLLLTVPVDSFFWQKFPEWPELTAFLFNVLEGKSSDWGTSPWHFYFSSSLPRILFNPAIYLACIPLALAVPATRVSASSLLTPNLIFIAICSLIPHKERRFIIYVLPPITAAASLGATWVWNRRSRSILYGTISLGLAASILLSLAGNVGMLAISSMNYPGAHAIYALHQIAMPDAPVVRVHMDTLTIMTGATRFLELEANLGLKEALDVEAQKQTQWVYDKTEERDKRGNATFWNSFDYALAELPERLSGDWEILATIEGFDGVEILKRDDDARPVGGGQLAKLWSTFIERVRSRVTRGRWPQLRMRPMIHVLRNKNSMVAS